MSFSRRWLLLAAAAAWSLPAPLAAAQGSAGAMGRLRSLMGPPESARVIGSAYLERFPQEAEASTLLRLILDRLALVEPEAAALGAPALRGRLAAGLRADFADGHLVDVGGWLLSRTEARLCAAWALPGAAGEAAF